MKKPSWFAFFLVLAVSCLDDPDCFQLHNDILGFTFRVMGTGQGDSVLLKNFTTTSPDTIIISFNLQLNYFQSEGNLDFEGIEENNFLSFGYTVKNQFISEDCGSSFVLSDLRILDHDFDSVRIVNTSPTKNGGTNIEIYRCPETDTLTLNFSQLFATSNGVTITNKRSSFISHPFDSITADFEGNVFSGRAATVKLPVDITKNETAFIFKTDITQDTLIVRYSRVTETRYRPCGIQTFVNDLAIKEHTFDSISFGLNADEEPVRALQDPQIANLRIFDCPKTNMLQIEFRSSAGAPQNVTITSITADHFAENLLTQSYTNNAVVVPVNLASDGSTFYIQYQDNTMDTVRIQYTRTSVSLFNACPDPVIINVREASDLPNIRVLPASTTLQFPPVTNVEIIK